MKKELHILILFVTGCLVTLSCKKSNDPGKEVNLLPASITRTDHLSGQGTTRLDFTYNEKNMITGISSEYTVSGFNSARLEYDANDKLIKVTRLHGTGGAIYEFDYTGLTPVRLNITHAGTEFGYPVVSRGLNIYTIDDLHMTFNTRGDFVSAVTDAGVTIAELEFGTSGGLFQAAEIPQPAMVISGLYLGLTDMLFLAKKEITGLSGGGLRLDVSTLKRRK